MQCDCFAAYFIPRILKNTKNNAHIVWLTNTKAMLIFAFRLEKASAIQMVHPRGLIGDALYEVSFTDSGETVTVFGRELELSGITFRNMPEESSEIVRIQRKSTKS